MLSLKAWVPSFLSPTETDVQTQCARAAVYSGPNYCRQHNTAQCDIISSVRRVDRGPRVTHTAKRVARADRQLLRRLPWFRYHLRQLLRFSERAARAEGVTPQQHQLLLGIAGYTSRG